MRTITGEVFHTIYGTLLIPDEQDREYREGEKLVCEGLAFVVDAIHAPTTPDGEWALRLCPADILFSYTLYNAWDLPLTEFYLLDGDTPAALYIQKGKDPSVPVSGTCRRVDLDASAIRRAKALLAGFDAADAKPERLRHVAVLDGFSQKFSFSAGGKTVSLTGYNMAYCGERPELYPNAMGLVRLLEDIRDLTEGYGVPADVFQLEI